MFLKVKKHAKCFLKLKILIKLFIKTVNLPLKTITRKNLHPLINEPSLYKRP